MGIPRIVFGGKGLLLLGWIQFDVGWIQFDVQIVKCEILLGSVF